MMISKDLEYYVSLPYKVEITPDEDGGFNASIPDLKGCVAFGETVEEAYQTIEDVKRNWIEIALERGWQIPEPRPDEIREYSGKYVVRLPRHLHRKLAEMAETEGTSLNQLSVAFLAEGAERKRLEDLSVQYDKEHKALRSYVATFPVARSADTFDAGEDYIGGFRAAAKGRIYKEQEYTMLSD